MTTDVHSRLGTAVRSERAARGWTREVLAVRAGLSYGGVTRLELGGPATVSTVDAVAAAFDVPLAALFGEAHKPASAIA